MGGFWPRAESDTVATNNIVSRGTTPQPGNLKDGTSTKGV
jgi:hypothetical protein